MNLRTLLSSRQQALEYSKEEKFYTCKVCGKSITYYSNIIQTGKFILERNLLHIIMESEGLHSSRFTSHVFVGFVCLFLLLLLGSHLAMIRCNPWLCTQESPWKAQVCWNPTTIDPGSDSFRANTLLLCCFSGPITSHFNIHPGEKPCASNKCSKSVTQSSSLTQH